LQQGSTNLFVCSSSYKCSPQPPSPTLSADEKYFNVYFDVSKYQKSDAFYIQCSVGGKIIKNSFTIQICLLGFSYSLKNNYQFLYQMPY